MKVMALLVVCLLSVGCDRLTAVSPIAPEVVEASGSGDARPMALIVGTWSGEEVASHGESGNLTAIFDTTVDSTARLSVRLIWHSARLNVDYRGTASGTLGNLNINADADNPPGGTRCGYHATARLNSTEDYITGEYTGTGGGICNEKAGAFVLKRQGPPVCQGSGFITFPAREHIAHYPAGVAPVYPTERGPYAFTIPVGTWDLSAVTGDNHSEKPGEKPQGGEVLRFRLSDGQVTPASVDVPEDRDTQASGPWRMTLAAPVTSVLVQHAGPLPVLEPTDSVYAVSLRYDCPGVAR